MRLEMARVNVCKQNIPEEPVRMSAWSDGGANHHWRAPQWLAQLHHFQWLNVHQLAWSWCGNHEISRNWFSGGFPANSLCLYSLANLHKHANDRKNSQFVKRSKYSSAPQIVLCCCVSSELQICALLHPSPIIIQPITLPCMTYCLTNNWFFWFTITVSPAMDIWGVHAVKSENKHMHPQYFWKQKSKRHCTEQHSSIWYFTKCSLNAQYNFCCGLNIALSEWWLILLLQFY